MNEENQPITTTDSQFAKQMISGPSIGLLITGILGAVSSLATFIMFLVGVSVGSLWLNEIPDLPEWSENVYEGAFGLGSAFVGVLVAIFIIYAALKMKELNHYGLCIAASVLAMIPCISPCCIIGLPIGIWCLVVLTKPEVKSVFQ